MKNYLLHSSYTYFDSNGGTHELDLEEVHATKPDPLCKSSRSELFMFCISDYFEDQCVLIIDEQYSLSVLYFVASHTMSLIDGINQSEVRRRALILFCITHLNKNAKVISGCL